MLKDYDVFHPFCSSSLKRPSLDQQLIQSTEGEGLEIIWAKIRKVFEGDDLNELDFQIKMTIKINLRMF